MQFRRPKNKPPPSNGIIISDSTSVNPDYTISRQGTVKGGDSNDNNSRGLISVKPASHNRTTVPREASPLRQVTEVAETSNNHQLNTDNSLISNNYNNTAAGSNIPKKQNE